jgi:hypothetical protein
MREIFNNIRNSAGFSRRYTSSATVDAAGTFQCAMTIDEVLGEGK